MHCEVLPPDVNSGITGTVWGLILDRTTVYPTSGGQPHDLCKIGYANVRYGTADQLSQLGVRKEVERSGILRAIEIEAADLQPCGGTHVKGTGQIGVILVRRCNKVRQDWRVEFVCGGRAERAARHDFQLLCRTAEKLSCAPEGLVSSATRALADPDANLNNVRAPHD